VNEAHVCCGVWFDVELPIIMADGIVVFALLDEIYAKRDRLGRFEWC